MAYTNPRIIPHETEHCEADGGGTEVHEINPMSYGDAWDPEAGSRVHQTPWTFDPDQDGVAK